MENLLYGSDFNMLERNPSGIFVRVEEINKMILYGVILINRDKLKEYKFDTTVIYDKKKYSREEAMKLWFNK